MFKFKNSIFAYLSLILLSPRIVHFTGSWKLAPSAGAMKVGPNINDGSWWSSSGADVETRACLFDDEYVFSEDGTFQNILQDTTWLESWQGVSGEERGPVVAPHDGSKPLHGIMMKQRRQSHYQESELTWDLPKQLTVVK